MALRAVVEGSIKSMGMGVMGLRHLHMQLNERLPLIGPDDSTVPFMILSLLTVSSNKKLA
jgi:hypothetical protein